MIRTTVALCVAAAAAVLDVRGPPCGGGLGLASRAGAGAGARCSAAALRWSKGCHGCGVLYIRGVAE